MRNPPVFATRFACLTCYSRTRERLCRVRELASNKLIQQSIVMEFGSIFCVGVQAPVV